MFIAMNRFTVRTENAEAFEALWLGRDSHLKDMDGFVEFHMLKGPEAKGTILYASHTVWASEDAFRDWTRSTAFRDAHKNAGATAKLHEGSPTFEGFSTIQHIA
ncbi:antibiotic biosynthesis monooxygenase family protein [Roseobacter weihaiensis]|uniref:antibiotic biosynthesis monooxygenase family protein n=1 Tax=Roseobacter weihaiensis TaxID=2763262 RepID=UPI001D0B4382|nr:antibiotic biosynthesis monooxygenase [Roseobacter sp. H9]